MGKISSGCDIAFTIGDETVRMGSSLSYEQASIEEIVKELVKNEAVRLKLYELLKYEQLVKEVTPEMVEQGGFVSNNTVAGLAKRYSGLNWEGVDQSTAIFTADWFKYYNNDLTGAMIILINPRTGAQEKIPVVNPNNLNEVKRLNEYLRVKKLIRTSSEEVNSILDNSDLESILDLIKTYDPSQEGTKIETLLKRKDPPKQKIQLLLDEKNKKEFLLNLKIHSVRDLLECYIQNKQVFIGRQYQKGEQSYSMSTELDRVIQALQGRDTTIDRYLDIFANEIVAHSVRDLKHDGHKISFEYFVGALQTKLANLELNASELNADLRKVLKSYIAKPERDPQKVKRIVDLLIDLSDDEFSYSYLTSDKSYIYLKDVPRVLGERFPEFTYKSIDMLKPVELYKGYTIYQDSTGKFYYSRHPITVNTYGTRYSTSKDCRDRIDNRVKYNSLSKESLIEFKTKKDEVVFVPNRLIRGQVIKSLNLHFNQNLKLNSVEESMLYDNLSEDNNTLDSFYDYVVGIVDSKSDRIRSELVRKIDTAEKAACFIFALNEVEGTVRSIISTQTFDKLVKRIDDAKNDFEYYVVEEVSDPINSDIGGFRRYRNLTKEGSSKRPVYKVMLTKINSVEMRNGNVKYDLSGRALSSTRLLKDLANKMQSKLGITIHVESLSDLEGLFKQWGQEMPPNTHGFVRNGEIYINMSNASQTDLFHEYTHIMLGVLKAKNFDNYYSTVDALTQTAYGKKVKERMRSTYPNLADSDLNEEVFADLLGKYLAGRDMDAFLNNQLSIQKLVLDEKLGSIFGAKAISSELYNLDWKGIFNQFSYDLGLMMNEDNGIHISDGIEFRQATNWIESQIAEYKKENSITGIYEKCD